MSKVKTKKRRGLAVYLVLFLALGGVFISSLDARHPELKLLGQEYMTVQFGDVFEDPGVDAKSVGRVFGSIGREGAVEVTGEVNTRALGDYQLIYTLEAAGQQTQVMRTVTVTDTTAPVIELIHDESYKPDWFDGYEEEGFTATDNHDGDLTEMVKRVEKEGCIEYTVTDSFGNQAVVERKLDYSSGMPVITLEGGEDYKTHIDIWFTDPGYSAVDGEGNDLTDMVQVSGQVSPRRVGTYELEYFIENGRGDKVSVTRTVELEKAEWQEQILPEGEKIIYLTFDDGPGPYTAQLLDVLKKYDAKATFFITGADPDYFDMIGRAYDEGHAIAVHTYTHNYRQIYASENAYINDFIKTQELIYEQTGEYTKLFRFPGGSSNMISAFNPGIMRHLATLMRNMGYVYFDWNVTSGDAGDTTSTWQVYQNVINGCAQYDINVVLQHDIKDFSVNAVEDILIWGANNGYSFQALTENSYGARHSIYN